MAVRNSAKPNSASGKVTSVNAEVAKCVNLLIDLVSKDLDETKLAVISQGDKADPAEARLVSEHIVNQITALVKAGNTANVYTGIDTLPDIYVTHGDSELLELASLVRELMSPEAYSLMLEKVKTEMPAIKLALSDVNLIEKVKEAVVGSGVSVNDREIKNPEVVEEVVVVYKLNPSREEVFQEGIAVAIELGLGDMSDLTLDDFVGHPDEDLRDSYYLAYVAGLKNNPPAAAQGVKL